jgi:LPXTG-motif cell wall-anchored protein
VPDRRCIAVVAAIAAVALAPGAALAQTGAGDEQYQDPFSGNSQPAPKAKPKPKPAPVQPVPHQQLPSKQTLPATQSPSELPRTGLDLLPLTLAGVGLVAAGLLLLVRRRASDGRH